MTVREMIAELQKLPQDAKVYAVAGDPEWPYDVPGPRLCYGEDLFSPYVTEDDRKNGWVRI